MFPPRDPTQLSEGGKVRTGKTSALVSCWRAAELLALHQPAFWARALISGLSHLL